MPNLNLQPTLKFQGIKSYNDDKNVNLLKVIQYKDNNVSKLYFNNTNNFLVGSTANLPNYAGVLTAPVTARSWYSGYSILSIKPYLVDQTIPKSLTVANNLIAQAVNYDTSINDWFQIAFLPTTSASNLRVRLITDAVYSITPVNYYTYTATGGTALIETIRQFNIAGMVATGAPTNAIKFVEVFNAGANAVTPIALYQANNPNQFAGTDLNFPICCVDSFELTRALETAEDLCGGKKVGESATKDGFNVKFKVKEESAWIWAMAFGVMPDVANEDIFVSLGGFGKNQSVNAFSAGQINIGANRVIGSVSTSDCSALQAVTTDLGANLTTGQYFYDSVTGILKTGTGNNGVYPYITVAESKLGTVLTPKPLSLGYLAYGQFQRISSTGTQKTYKFSNIQMKTPTVSTTDTSDDIEFDLTINFVNTGDVKIILS